MIPPDVMPTDRLLRPREGAERLAISRAQIYKMMSTGQVHAVHIGSSVRVPASELVRLMTEGTV